jgi:hypothetical protein
VLAAAFRGAHGPLAQLAFDVVDKFSPAQRPSDRRAYTHKLNFELDTSVAAFNWLPRRSMVAWGWSFSLVFVVPVAPM